MAAPGSGAWPEARVLTRGPGPGFACCGVCRCVHWTELSPKTPSFRKVQSLTPIFPFSQRCHQKGEVLWLAVAVPTPETGSCLRRKRVEKGHSPVPTSGPCLGHPFHNQSSFCWASREQPGLGSRDTGRDPLQAQASAHSGLPMVHEVPCGVGAGNDCWSEAGRKKWYWPVWVLGVLGCVCDFCVYVCLCLYIFVGTPTHVYICVHGC